MQLHRFIGSNGGSEEESAGDTETDITGTVGEESETESSSLQPRTTRKLDIIITTITIIIKSRPLTTLNFSYHNPWKNLTLLFCGLSLLFLV